MITRRKFFSGAAALVGASALAQRIVAGSNLLAAQNTPAPAAGTKVNYRPVITPNGSTLPWVMKDGVKEFHLIAEPVRREFAPGMWVNCWGYNGQSPGPTIEAVEGDRVRILLTNKLAEPTTIHWHGLILPNGMDGVGGVTQKHIPPGETYAYEFTLRQHGAQMYHPHSDEMTQMAMGMEGFFIIHPKDGLSGAAGPAFPDLPPGMGHPAGHIHAQP
jgi:FtsP/CotA-like multicopper oxidase with cupredoxin domain